MRPDDKQSTAVTMRTLTRSSRTMSCSSAATSTPVGPPPTTTNDSSFCRSYKARRAVGAEADWTTPASTACISVSQKLHEELIATTTGLARKTTCGVCMRAFSACDLVREQKLLTSNLLQTNFYHLQVCLKGMGLWYQACLRTMGMLM